MSVLFKFTSRAPTIGRRKWFIDSITTFMLSQCYNLLCRATNRSTFKCPYCDRPNLDREGIIEHVNNSHSNDIKQVVRKHCHQIVGSLCHHRYPNFATKIFLFPALRVVVFCSSPLGFEFLVKLHQCFYWFSW